MESPEYGEEEEPIHTILGKVVNLSFDFSHISSFELRLNQFLPSFWKREKQFDITGYHNGL